MRRTLVIFKRELASYVSRLRSGEIKRFKG